MSARSIRAKFVVQESGAISRREAIDPTQPYNLANTEVRKVHEKVVLGGVYATGSEKAENVNYAKSTPQGRIELTIDNPDAWGVLVPGDEFYVTFARAPVRCSKCFGQGVTYAGSTKSPCDRCGETGLDPEQPDW